MGAIRDLLDPLYIVVFNSHDVVLLMTAVQSFLLALLLLTNKKQKKISNLLLAGFMLAHVLYPLAILIHWGEAFRYTTLSISANLFHWLGFPHLIEAPLLYWYTKSLIYSDYSLKKIDCCHLLPLLIYGIYIYVVYFGLAYSEKVELIETHSLHYTWHYNLADISRNTVLVAYGVLSLLLIRDYRHRLQEKYSDIKDIDFSWLAILIMGFLAVRVAVMFEPLALMAALEGVLPIEPIQDTGLIGLFSHYVVFILINALVFYSLSYSSVFQGITENVHSGKTISSERVDIYRQKIDKLMRQEKPYLIPNITLEGIANMLSMSPRTLSFVINRHYKKNFLEFINAYRIHEAKVILGDPQQQDRMIIDILTEVGFNSKTVFNAFFKKLVGVTPTEYRKKRTNLLGIS